MDAVTSIAGIGLDSSLTRLADSHRPVLGQKSARHRTDNSKTVVVAAGRATIARIIDHCGVMNTTYPFNRPQAQTVRIQLQTLPTDLIALAELDLRVRDKLAPTFHTQMILFATSVPIFADMLGTALRTLHG